MSSGNLVELSIVRETAYDVTPVNSPDWETLRYTSEDFDAQAQVQQSEEIRSDRMVGDQFKVSTETSGGFEFEMSANTFDSLIDGAMMSTPAAGVWKIGVEDISYTVTKNFTDLSANHFHHFSGQRVSEMSLTFSHGEALKGSFAMAGASVVTNSASLVGTGTLAPATTTRVMNSVSDLTGIEIGGVSFTGCIQEISLNVNNNLRPANCIGKDTPSDQILGTASVTGTIKAYLTNTTVQWFTNQMLNQTGFDLRFIATDGTTSYEFDIPNCRLSGSAPNSDGIDTDVMIEADFTALFDASTSTSLLITKA